MASHKSITVSYHCTTIMLACYLQKVVLSLEISILLVGLMGGSRKMHGSFRLAVYRRITFSCIYFQLFLCKSDTWKKHLTTSSLATVVLFTPPTTNHEPPTTTNINSYSTNKSNLVGSANIISEIIYKAFTTNHTFQHENPECSSNPADLPPTHILYIESLRIKISFVSTSCEHS